MKLKSLCFFLGTQVFCLFIVHLFIYLLFDFVFVLIIENNILKIFFQNHFFDLKVSRSNIFVFFLLRKTAFEIFVLQVTPCFD